MGSAAGLKALRVLDNVERTVAIEAPSRARRRSSSSRRSVPARGLSRLTASSARCRATAGGQVH